jgi:hypothetical protein
MVSARVNYCGELAGIDPAEYADNVDARLGMDIQAAETKLFQAQLQAQKTNDLYDDMVVLANEKYNGDQYAALRAMLTQHDASKGAPSLEARVLSEIDQSMAEFTDGMDNSYFKLWQRISGHAELSDEVALKVRHELDGLDSGDAVARTIAQNFKAVAERLRRRFNMHGGAIGKLQDWGMPQIHRREKMLGQVRSGRKAKALREMTPEDFANARNNWVDFTAARLDRARMRDFDGNPLNDQELRGMLEKTFDRIVYDGADEVDLNAVGKGKKLANRHGEHRVLHFANSNAAHEYARQYGSENVIEVMSDHLRRMAEDTALVREMGPSPQRTFDVLENAASKNRKLAGGKQKLLSPGQDNVRDVWSRLGGRVDQTNSSRADAYAWARFALSAARLGSSVISTIPDLAFGAFTTFFNGGSVPRYTIQRAQQLMPGIAKMGRKVAREEGLIVDSIIAELRTSYRWGEIEGSAKLQRYSNAFYTLNLMKPFQRGSEAAFRTEMLMTVGDIAKKLDRGTALNKRQLAFLKRYGLAESDVVAAGNVRRPDGIIALSQLDDNLRTKIGGAIRAESQYGAMESTARTRALTQKTELHKFMFQWKSFIHSMMTSHGARLVNTVSGKHDIGAAGLTFTLGLMGSLTALGVVSLQLRELSKGRGLMPLEKDGELNWELLAGGAVQSGIGGLFADFLFHQTGNQYGKSFASNLAPPAWVAADEFITAGLFFDVAKADSDERLDEFLSGLDKRTASALRAFPLLNSHFLTRAAWDRLVVANLASEEEAARLSDNQRKVAEERGNGFWWEPD